MEETNATAAFGALANATRLRILKRLIAAGPAGLTAGSIAEAVGASPSRASFHLSALSDAGLIAAERLARQIIYRADYAAMGGLIAYLLHDCCGDDPRVRACCDAPAGC